MKKILMALMLVLGMTGCVNQMEEMTVKMATFNVRYANLADGANYWAFRRPKVCELILQQDLEIIGMQEVLHAQAEDLKATLPGYAMVGVGRDDGKEAGEYAPLFYKKERFEVLDSNTFWLSQYPDSAAFIGWDGACTRIATWAKFKDRKSGRVFMAVNTHFDHVGTEARRQGALLIIDRIKQIVGDQPAILTGDFNVTEHSEAYRTLTTDEYVLKDAHKVAATREGGNYTFHNFGKIPEAQRTKIDFVFVSNQVEVLKSYIPVPAPQDTVFLSDHNPQIVDIVL